MEINKEIIDILKEFKIDKSDGLLCLLGIYYNLDVERTCSEETIKAINVTKIVERDYPNKVIKWNMPLFNGQQTEWDWVKTEFNEMWRIAPDRKASNPDVIKRMQAFFVRFPSYRKQDIMEATKAYFKSVKNPQYLKNSAAFIFDGQGAMKKSILAGWCETTKGKSGDNRINRQIAK